MLRANHQHPIQPGRQVVVVGLGKSGFSAVRFLHKLGVRVSVSEGGARVAEEAAGWLREEGIFWETGGHSAELFLAADAILVSPGVPLDLPVLAQARRKGIPVLGELALAPHYLKTPVVAVTGTNGKSTVTTLLGELFKAAGQQVFVGGNIGTPLADYLNSPQEADIAVLEVSSFQLDTAGEFRPRAAVLLNISPDHLDRYASFGAYAASKFSIFAAQQSGDFAIINADDPEISQRINAVKRLPGQLYRFGRAAAGQPGVFLEHGEVVLSLGGEEEQEAYSLAHTSLAGPPNSSNAMAAVLTARLLGCTPEAIRQGLQRFAPLPHRLVPLAEIRGVQFYDDSKATNEGAVVAALEAMVQPVVLIAGGREKGGDYSLLKAAVKDKVRALVLLGEAREPMARALAGVAEIESSQTMEEAVATAYRLAKPGEAVLLSPACASFDMFGSYAQRGEAFQRCVKGLQEKEKAA